MNYVLLVKVHKTLYDLPSVVTHYRLLALQRSPDVPDQLAQRTWILVPVITGHLSTY